MKLKKEVWGAGKSIGEVQIMKVLILPLVFIIGGACGDGPSQKGVFKNADKIIYRFEDASVPPRYHRSYTITVTGDTALITVDSYGDILEKESVSIDRSSFDKIIRLIIRSKLTLCDRSDGSGCTGGTGESLKVMKDNEELFKGSVYHCGGEDFGDLCGDIDSVAREMESLFPNFKRLIQ